MSVPLDVRSRWIRALYPSVRVIEAWDGPTEGGYAPRSSRPRGLRDRHVEDARITHFYSSEPYGEHMSRALGAVNRLVDHARAARAGLGARSDETVAHRAYVHPLVYRDLIVNIVFLGAPCTGKTTLAQRLAREFHTAVDARVRP